MAKIKRSLLKDIKKAAREIKNKESQENKQQKKTAVSNTVNTWSTTSN